MCKYHWSRTWISILSHPCFSSTGTELVDQIPLSVTWSTSQPLFFAWTYSIYAYNDFFVNTFPRSIVYRRISTRRCRIWVVVRFNTFQFCLRCARRATFIVFYRNHERGIRYKRGTRVDDSVARTKTRQNFVRTFSSIVVAHFSTRSYHQIGFCQWEFQSRTI